MKNRILKAALIGGTIGFVLQLGFYFCWFAQISVVSELLSSAAFWPLGILSLFFGEAMPSWVHFPILNLVSLVGWSCVAVLCASLFYFASCCRRIQNEKPVA
jgi:hypothetical protein